MDEFLTTAAKMRANLMRLVALLDDAVGKYGDAPASSPSSAVATADDSPTVAAPSNAGDVTSR